MPPQVLGGRENAFLPFSISQSGLVPFRAIYTGSFLLFLLSLLLFLNSLPLLPSTSWPLPHFGLLHLWSLPPTSHLDHMRPWGIDLAGPPHHGTFFFKGLGHCPSTSHNHHLRTAHFYFNTLLTPPHSVSSSPTLMLPHMPAPHICQPYSALPSLAYLYSVNPRHLMSCMTPLPRDFMLSS